MLAADESDQRDHWVELVRQQVQALRFGVVQITVHESRVVQIETTEKIRLPQVPGPGTPEQKTAGKNKSTKQDRPRQSEGS
jgi:hypothetical protein